MAFPSSTSANTSFGGYDVSITGKPRTGLPANVIIGSILTPENIPTNYVDPSNTLQLAYFLFEYQVRNGGTVLAFVDRNKTYWFWSDCSQRWWTTDLHGKVNFDVGGNTGRTGVLTRDRFGNYVSTAGTGQSSGAANFDTIMWSTWDSFKNEWIRKNKICDSDIRVQDDCAKYGINCPEPLPTGKVFTRIDVGDILPGKIETITYGIWTDDVGNLTTFHQCQLSSSVLPYYRTVYNKACGTCGSEPQFDVAYGHDAGSGSIDLGGYDWMSPTNAVYGQYRLLCLDRNQLKFTVGTKELSQIYVVNVRRDRMQERIDEGNIELNLAHLSGSEFVKGGNQQNAHTGSNVRLSGRGKVLRLIDDSRINFDELSDDAWTGSYREHADVKAHRVSHGGDVYYMVSGSIERGVYNKTNPKLYGLFYPKLGVIVLDGDKLDSDASFMSVTGSQVAGDNAAKLFTAISGAAQYTDPSGDTMGFQARRKETEFTEYYFVRVKNGDYNYTNNPTFQTGSLGQIVDDFLYDPKVYFTTVGLYNEQKECLAVGKLTRAIQKTATSEALFKLKLKY